MKVGYQILADLQQQQAFKQWGKILGDTVNLKIINFPVSFNECFGGLALFNGDPVAAAEYATITDITNTNFKIYMYANNAGTGYANANIFYLFLGAQQQWGIKTEPYGRVTFPISFQACFGVITHFNSDPTNYAETSSVTNFSNTDFYVVFYFNNSGSNAAGSQVFWVAIGNS